LIAREQDSIVSVERILGEEAAMIRTLSNSRAFSVRARPVVLRVVRRDGPAVIVKSKVQRPAWSLLYAAALLTGAGLAVLGILLPEGPGRTAMELVALFAGLALVRLWIGCNRRRLAQAERQDGPLVQAQAAAGPSAQEAG
jgi:hypothetical protein